MIKGESSSPLWDSEQRSPPRFWNARAVMSAAAGMLAGLIVLASVQRFVRSPPFAVGIALAAACLQGVVTRSLLASRTSRFAIGVLGAVPCWVAGLCVLIARRAPHNACGHVIAEAAIWSCLAIPTLIAAMAPVHLIASERCTDENIQDSDRAAVEAAFLLVPSVVLLGLASGAMGLPGFPHLRTVDVRWATFGVMSVTGLGVIAAAIRVIARRATGTSSDPPELPISESNRLWGLSWYPFLLKAIVAGIISSLGGALAEHVARFPISLC